MTLQNHQEPFNMLCDARVVSVETNTVKLILSDGNDCWIPIEEFFNERGRLAVRTDDRVAVARDESPVAGAKPQYSVRKARQMLGLMKLRSAYEEGEPVTGFVECAVDGGFRVMVKGAGAFLPATPELTAAVPEENGLIGSTGKFRICNLSPDGSAATLALLQFKRPESERDISALTDCYEVGDVAEGRVRKLVAYGAFVDIAGVVCLLHVSDLSWEKVTDMTAFLSVGERVRVRILRIDPVSKRINVGIKQLLKENPWESLESRFPIGTKLLRDVKAVTEYGFFVDLVPGIQGLVHISELCWGKRFPDPFKVVRRGDRVEVMVTQIDRRNEKVALSYKRCLPNPWEAFAAAYRPGDQVRGRIRTINTRGVFVEVAPGIDAMLMLGDLPVGKARIDMVREWGIGTTIEATITVIDPEREKIRLSMRGRKDNEREHQQ